MRSKLKGSFLSCDSIYNKNYTYSMLISHPLIMLRHTPWMMSIESFCCALSVLFPKVFCTSVLTWSIYVLIVQVCHDTFIIALDTKIVGVLVGVIGTILYFLCVYTYFKVLRSGPGFPSDFEELKIHNMSLLSKPRYNSSNPYDTNENVNTSSSLLRHAETVDDSASLESEQPPSDYMNMHMLKNNNSSFRYCAKCSVWKPDRCHHCATCNTCVLRMDHHCPWFAMCVGYYNHKFFAQFLIYLTTYSIFTFVVSLCILWKFFADEMYSNQYLSLNLVFLFILSFAFFISVGCFTGFLLYMIFQNKTTIEFQENRWNFKNDRNGGSFQYEFDGSGKKKKLGNIFDLGYSRNWKSIMGPSWYHWLLPVTVTNKSIEARLENGINFEINQEVYDKWCYNALLQDQLNRQLADYKNRIRTEREATQQ